MWYGSVGDWGPGLLDALSEAEDPRRPKGVRHPLPAVVALSVCAMLGGARSLYAIALSLFRNYRPVIFTDIRPL